MGANPALLRRLGAIHGPFDMRGKIYTAALARAPFSLMEKVYVAGKKGTQVNPPVFILGHWRSGTTHLYNILANAPRFQTVTPYQAGLPWDFMTLSRLVPGLLEKNLPQGRYIDGVAVTPTAPQEDEFALANMTEHSFLHALYFPGDFFETFNRGLFFEGLNEAQVGDWRQKLKYFYTKLQIAGPGKTLLVKNPVYTARVALLCEMFPEAKFIHIRRNPYKVFYSMRNFYAQLLDELALQPHDLKDLDDHILSVFTRMMEALERDTRGLARDRFIEFDFADLQKKPLSVIKTIYQQLRLGDFRADEGHYKAYLKSIKGYKKNVYDFKNAEVKKIETHWRKYIKAGGYTCP